MVKPASQQGDRQMAKSSCLDDKGRKNKMQKKTRTLSSKSWGTPSAVRHFPAGEGSSSRTRGQEEAFSPGHPAATRRPVGVDATGPDAGNGGHRMQCPGPCGCQGLPWRTGRQQTENHSDCSRQGFHSNPRLPSPFL